MQPSAAQQQLSPEQLKEAMERYDQQQAQEREQASRSELKVWQLRVFQQRSEFWQKMFDQCFKEVGEVLLSQPKHAAIETAKYADAALAEWDRRFLPEDKPNEENPQ